MKPIAIVGLALLAMSCVCAPWGAFAQNRSDDDLYRIQRQQAADAQRLQRESQERARAEEARRRAEEAGRGLPERNSSSPAPSSDPFPSRTKSAAEVQREAEAQRASQEQVDTMIKRMREGAERSAVAAFPAFQQRFDLDFAAMNIAQYPDLVTKMWSVINQLPRDHHGYLGAALAHIGVAYWEMADSSAKITSPSEVRKMAIAALLGACLDHESADAAEALTQILAKRAGDIPAESKSRVEAAVLNLKAKSLRDPLLDFMKHVDLEARRSKIAERDLQTRAPELVAQHLDRAKQGGGAPLDALLEAELALAIAARYNLNDLISMAITEVQSRRWPLEVRGKDETLKQVRAISTTAGSGELALRAALKASIDGEYAQYKAALARRQAESDKQRDVLVQAAKLADQKAARSIHVQCVLDLQKEEQAFENSDLSVATAGVNLGRAYVHCGIVASSIGYLERISQRVPASQRVDWWRTWLRDLRVSASGWNTAGTDESEFVRAYSLILAVSDRVNSVCSEQQEVEHCKSLQYQEEQWTMQTLAAMGHNTPSVKLYKLALSKYPDSHARIFEAIYGSYLSTQAKLELLLPFVAAVPGDNAAPYYSSRAYADLGDYMRALKMYELSMERTSDRSPALTYLKEYNSFRASAGLAPVDSDFTKSFGWKGESRPAAPVASGSVQR